MSFLTHSAVAASAAIATKFYYESIIESLIDSFIASSTYEEFKGAVGDSYEQIYNKLILIKESATAASPATSSTSQQQQQQQQQSPAATTSQQQQHQQQPPAATSISHITDMSRLQSEIIRLKEEVKKKQDEINILKQQTNNSHTEIIKVCDDVKAKIQTYTMKYTNTPLKNWDMKSALSNADFMMAKVLLKMQILRVHNANGKCEIESNSISIPDTQSTNLAIQLTNISNLIDIVNYLG